LIQSRGSRGKREERKKGRREEEKEKWRAGGKLLFS
jgi:hypothetical protein